jgi:23S rRNA U2552 (ribose-2'-O)-methylase RlmE/FtsJ
LAAERDHFLHRYFLANGARGLHKWIHYFDVYEAHFERFRGRGPKVMEIGVAAGGSLGMWKAYFGAESRIVGVDIDPKCKAYDAPGIEVFIGSQADPGFLAQVCERHAPFDVVVDDGSHRSVDMIASFEYLYPRLAEDGVYLVEDTYFCYRRATGGGLKKAGTFIEYAKDKVDELHASHDIGIPISDLTRTTQGISFYDSVVVFEKAPQGNRQHPATGAMRRKLPVDGA